jgi:hypothetical protein
MAKSATQEIADQWAHAHAASTQSAQYATIAAAIERGGSLAQLDPDVRRALDDRADLIRQAAAARLSNRPAVRGSAHFDPPPAVVTGPEI